MSELENRQLVEQAYTTFKAGDIPTLLQSLSEDVTWQLPEIENVPFAASDRGAALSASSSRPSQAYRMRVHSRSVNSLQRATRSSCSVITSGRSKPTGAPSRATSRTSSPSAAVRSWPSTSTWTQPRSPKRIVRVEHRVGAKTAPELTWT
jgi:hypothetical protein